jgi:diguanylate cyclase
MIDCDKIIDSINVGIVTIDDNLVVWYMNKWFALHANIDAQASLGQSLTTLFELSPEHIVSLHRHIKTSLILQTPSFYTADSNGHLFPIKHAITTKSAFEYMQQDITLVPYDIAQRKVTLLVYDQTVLMEEKTKCHKESSQLAQAVATANETIKKLESAKTKLVKQQEIIYKQAHYDSLTSLANRTLLHQRLQLLIEDGFENSKKFGVLFLDLDRFKEVNDTLGHDAGDELLIKISKILLSATRKSDTVARLGGDEFVLLIDDVKDEETLMRIADKIIEAIASPLTIKETPLHVTTSIGISLFPEHGADFNELIKHADTALYEAKAAGRNNYKMYKE